VQIKDIIESMHKSNKAARYTASKTEHARRSRIKIAHMYSTSGSMLFFGAISPHPGPNDISDLSLR